jgi:D-glycero-D-manno-heptose 1,7-bisphosphate phosphatase
VIPKKLIILDRDGVINQDSDQYIKSVDEWIPINGSIDAIAKLSQAGYSIAIATNQSGISRNYYDLYTLQAMHFKMHQLVRDMGGKIDLVTYCPHLPENNCECRKPKAGLLHKIARYFNLSLKSVPVVGDSLRDLQAAESVNASPILVTTGKGQKTLTTLTKNHHYPVYQDLSTFTKQLLS